MSQENPNSLPDENESSEEDEFESLSDDEKAAFEKIMAEIAEAEKAGSTDTKTSSSKSKGPKSDSGHDLTSSPAASKTDLKVQDNPTDSAINHSTETLSSPSKDPKDDTESNHKDVDSLDSDQQAVLDAIMHDIETKKEKKESTTSDTSGEDLSEDQQAALNQILAEIETKKKNDYPSHTVDMSESDEKDEDLSDDQQAALNQILAEIDSKKKGDAASSEETGDDETDSTEEGKDDLSDDQQAALDKIMAEIDSRKNDQTEFEESPSEPEDEKKDQGLSLDEFNSELTHLLNPQSDVQPESTDIPSPLLERKLPQGDTEALNKISEETDEKSSAPEASVPGTSAIDDFPILKELGSDDIVDTKKQNPRGKNRSKLVVNKKTRPKRIFALSVIASTVLLLSAGAYWGYKVLYVNSKKPLLMKPQQDDIQGQPLSSTPSLTENSERQTTSLENQPEAIEETADDVNPMILLSSQIATGRQRLQAKQLEIEDLRSYYLRGIDEDKKELQLNISQQQYRSLEQVPEESKTMLDLQSIQRRTAYVDKLESLLKRMHQSIETLLFIERRAQILALLTEYTSGIPVSDFELNANQQYQSLMSVSEQLNIDNLEIDKPKLKSIWEQLQQKPASATLSKSSIQTDDPFNASISQEICNGDYNRRHQLTKLSSKTASCLLNWRGKDLFLNELKQLSPSAAKVLAQWKGEWLSLNGLKELSPESAQYLATWTGKRLSLNGLVHLSPQATANLSQWKGDQLEMIGLFEIGPWKNYGTRLFLSEQLKRRLESR